MVNSVCIFHLFTFLLTTLVWFWNISGAIHPSVPKIPDCAVKEPRPTGSLWRRLKSDIRAFGWPDELRVRSTFWGLMSLWTAERENTLWDIHVYTCTCTIQTKTIKVTYLSPVHVDGWLQTWPPIIFSCYQQRPLVTSDLEHTEEEAAAQKVYKMITGVHN